MERGLAERGLSIARAELLWRLLRLGPRTQRELSQDLRCTGAARTLSPGSSTPWKGAGWSSGGPIRPIGEPRSSP